MPSLSRTFHINRIILNDKHVSPLEELMGSSLQMLPVSFLVGPRNLYLFSSVGYLGTMSYWEL